MQVFQLFNHHFADHAGTDDADGFIVHTGVCGKARFCVFIGMLTQPRRRKKAFHAQNDLGCRILGNRHGIGRPGGEDLDMRVQKGSCKLLNASGRIKNGL